MSRLGLILGLATLLSLGLACAAPAPAPTPPAAHTTRESFMQGCVRQAHDSALQEAESRCACAYQQLRAVFGSEPLDAASLEDSRMASVRARVAEQCPTPSHGPASSVVEPAGTR